MTMESRAASAVRPDSISSRNRGESEPASWEEYQPSLTTESNREEAELSALGNEPGSDSKPHSGPGSRSKTLQGVCRRTHFAARWARLVLLTEATAPVRACQS